MTTNTNSPASRDGRRQKLDVSMPPALYDDVVDAIDLNEWDSYSEWMRVAAMLALALEDDPNHPGPLAQVELPDDEFYDGLRERQRDLLGGDPPEAADAFETPLGAGE